MQFLTGKNMFPWIPNWHGSWALIFFAIFGKPRANLKTTHSLEKQSFVIRFDIWLVKLNKVLTMQAIAQCDTNEATYLVHSFSISAKTLQVQNPKLVMPYMSIHRIERDGKKIWVHATSEKETVISAAIGKAIESQEQVLYANQPHISWEKKIQSR